MNWKSALNWLIAVLLAVNLFLVAVLVSESWQRTHISSDTVRDAVTILQRYGVEISADAVETQKPDSESPSMDQAFSRETMVTLLESLSGEAYTGSYVIPGGLVYNTSNFVLTRHENGTMAFSAENIDFKEEVLNEPAQTNAEQIERQLSKRFPFLQNESMGFSVLSVFENDNLTVYRLCQTCNGRPIYANIIELFVADGKTVQLNGLWLFGSTGESGSLQCKDAASLLLANKQRFYGEKILSTSWGYYTSVQDDGNSAVLTPCWAVETEKNVLYFDAVSGEEIYW